MKPRMTRPGGIGVHTPLIDGIEKVTGRARYTADIAAPGALVGRILRSPHPHARIVSIDIRAAQADVLGCVHRITSYSGSAAACTDSMIFT